MGKREVCVHNRGLTGIVPANSGPKKANRYLSCTAGGKEDVNNDPQLNLCGCLVHVFEVGSGSCLGVIEFKHQQSAACISIIGYASYVYDPNVLGFYEACSELHLLRGEGIAGKAPGTNQPCSATDITGFSRTEYSLPDHAKLFQLSGAVAIHLRSTYTGPTDFVLEFFSSS
ncbi:hypothetical protein Tco_1369073 [Tanacetum coccineum]